MERNELVSISLFFNEEQLPGKGEDSAMRVTGIPNAALIACMDGCGGAGAQIYAKANNTSGARIASEHVGIALQQWFLENQYGFWGTGNKSAAQLAEEMKAAINKELVIQNEKYGHEESGVRSRLARTFPTTLAAVLPEIVAPNTIRCISFWAGDSRTYVFKASGLRQTSTDDIRGHSDPFAALENDSRLSNLVSISAEYEIHTAETVLHEPCMVLTATDGCFSYFRSPMEFEWVLLDTLMESPTPLAWEKNLRQAFASSASDDYTMNIAVLGFLNWNAVQNAYAPRWGDFKKTYYDPLEQILAAEDRQAHYALWQQYKQEYMPEDGRMQ